MADSLLDQVAGPAPQPQAAASQPQATQPQATPAPSQGGSLLDQVAGPQPPVAPPQPSPDVLKQRQDAEQARKAEIASHGVLHRAWNWVNQPIFDNVLPDDVKTSDILKATAFERLYGEAYIPGVNDFETKSETHFGGGKGEKPTDSQTKAAIRAFINGAIKDTSDTIAGFTSPLSVGAMALGPASKAAGAVGKIAKVLGPLAGTAFGAQGLIGAGKGVYHMAQDGVTPETTQETLGGLGQAALAGVGTATEIGEIGKSAQEGLRPQMKDVGGQPVPVRAEGPLASAVAKSVDPSVIEGAAKQTASAVQQGVGEVTKGAVGSEAGTTISDTDRFGVRGHADDLKQSSVPAYKALDRLSNNAFSDAQKMAKDSALDFSTEGREKNRTAMELQNSIMDAHRDALTADGYDVDEMKGNYRKQIALNKIATKLDAATSAAEGGGYSVDGKKLANIIDKIRRSPNSLFDKAGLEQSHVDTLGELADTLRGQQEIPKVGTLSKLMAKGIAVVLSGGHGITGLAEALTGESLAEKLGTKMATRMFGEAMQSEPLAKDLVKAIKSGNPTKLSASDVFQKYAKALWQDEQGNAGAGTVPMQGVDASTENPTNRHGEALDYTYKQGEHTVTTSDEDGRIGTLVAHDTRPGEVTISTNQIDKSEMRGTGRGPDQIEHLLNSVSPETKVLKSDISTTREARGAWDKLAKLYPEAVSKTVYKDGQTQYSVDMAKYRDSQTAPSVAAHPITQNHIEEAFPGQQVTKLDDHNFQVTLDNGKNVRIQLNDVVDGGGVELRPGEAVLGRWDKLDNGGVMQLAGMSDRSTLAHETFHAAMDMLPDDLRGSVLKKFGGDEEKAAEAYSEYDPKKPDTLWGRVADHFQKLYDQLFKPADAAFREIHEGQVWSRTSEKFDASTELRPDFSKKTYPQWEKDFRKKAAEMGATAPEIERHIKSVSPAFSMFREVINTPPELGGSNVMDNAFEGKKSTFEYNGFCPKNKDFNPTVASIEQGIGRKLTKQEMIGTTLLMHAEGHDAPCNYCYTLSGQSAVSENIGKSAREGVWASSNNAPETSLKLKTRPTPDKPETTQIFIPPVEERLLTDEAYRKAQTEKDPELADKVKMHQWYADKRVYGNLKARKPMAEGIIPARGAALRFSQEHIDELNSARGARVSGNADVTPYSAMDVAQDIADARLVGLKRYSYTKQPWYVRFVGNTGEKINMSITMNPANTDFISNDWSDSMNFSDAKELRSQFPNAGTMLMALNDSHILAGLRHDDVDMMIPFHGSRNKFPANLRESVQDYSRENHETFIKDGKTVPGDKEIKQTEHGGDLKTYLRLCEQKGYLPKFARFIYDNVAFNKSEGGVSNVHLKVDPETGKPEPPKMRKDTAKNFMKLVTDLSRPETPHEPIKGNVDMKYLEHIVGRMKEGTMPWGGEAKSDVVQKAVDRLKGGKPVYNGEMGVTYTPAPLVQIAPAAKK